MKKRFFHLKMELVEQKSLLKHREEQHNRIMEELETQRLPRVVSWTRRGFLYRFSGGVAAMKFLGAAGGGSIFGCNGVVVGDNLILASINKYDVSKLDFAETEDLDGDITLENTESTSAKGYVNMDVLNDSKQSLYGASGDYDIPGYRVNTYRWTMKNRLSPSDYHTRAEGGLNRVSSKWFKVGS